jgi:hypothetical protein
MIEPPGQIGMRRVFEVDDDICVAVKQAVLKELIGAMSEAGVKKFGIRIEGNVL